MPPLTGQRSQRPSQLSEVTGDQRSPQSNWQYAAGAGGHREHPGDTSFQETNLGSLNSKRASDIAGFAIREEEYAKHHPNQVGDDLDEMLPFEEKTALGDRNQRQGQQWNSQQYMVSNAPLADRLT